MRRQGRGSGFVDARNMFADFESTTPSSVMRGGAGLQHVLMEACHLIRSAR